MKQLYLVIPPNSEEVKDDQSSAVAYKYQTRNFDLVAKGYNGRGGRPVFHFLFKTEIARDKYINDFFENTRKVEQYKKSNDRRSNINTREIDVGDIFVASWGYSMTICDYYQVVKLIGNNSAVVRKLNKEFHDGKIGDSKTSGIKDSFKSGEIRIRVSGKKQK